MFCSKCGYSFTGGEEYCPKCGSKIVSNVSAPVYETNQSNNSSVANAEKVSEANNVLVWGILSVAFAELGIFGVIFACITNSKIKKFTELYGQLMPKVRIAKYLSLGGLIGGIFFTVFWSFMIVFYILYFFMLFGITFSEMMYF